MTDIDLKRLAVDRGYWDECGAPEDATHVGNRWGEGSEFGFKPCWYRLGNGAYFFYPEDQAWCPCADGEPCHTPVISRPTKMAQEVEWDGSGLPPVGWHGECTWGQKINWFECIMLPRHCLALYKHGEWSFMGIFPEAGHEFRSLKPKHERQRAELAELVLSGMKDCEYYPYETDVNSIADAILSKYNLEPKP